MGYAPFLCASDAPELLEAAWKSVEIYYQDFLDFFGAVEVTLSGHEAAHKLQLLQEALGKPDFAIATDLTALGIAKQQLHGFIER